MMRPNVRVWLVLTVAVALGPGAARADTASEAELQYQLGLELYKQKRYEEALQHLIASNRLVPNANVSFNVAQTYGLLHRDSEAFNWFETYLDFPGLDDAGRDRGLKAIAPLLPKVAVVDISSTPVGAELFVDRVDLGSVGKAPRKLAVPPGPRTLIAQLPGHHDARAEVDAALGATRPVTLTLTPIVGVLVLSSVPPGATVRREGSAEVLGQTPLKLTLPLGEARFTFELDGYVEQQRSASVREGAEVTVNVPLTQAASRVSVLSVSGAPEGAHVKLAGKELGQLPLSMPGLTPGTLELVVDAPAFEPYVGRVVLEPGAATRVDVHLEALGGGRFRWLHWVGYGAGAAAVIVGALFAAVAISNHDTFYSSPSRQTYDLVNRENVTADALLISGLVVAAVTLVLDRFVWPVEHTRGTVAVVR